MSMSTARLIILNSLVFLTLGADLALAKGRVVLNERQEQLAAAKSAFLRMCQRSDLTYDEKSFIDFIRLERSCETARRRLKEIEILYLGDDDYVNWQVLREMTSLRDLAIEGRSLPDLEFAGDLPQLEVLVLVGLQNKTNRPYDVKPLMKLDHLKLLRLADTPVQAESLAALQKRHPDLQIEQAKTPAVATHALAPFGTVSSLTK